jgi:hypothetical protein
VLKKEITNIKLVFDKPGILDNYLIRLITTNPEWLYVFVRLGYYNVRIYKPTINPCISISRSTVYIYPPKDKQGIQVKVYRQYGIEAAKAIPVAIKNFNIYTRITVLKHRIRESELPCI